MVLDIRTRRDFDIVQACPDGNCLFTSVLRTPHRNVQIRRAAVQWVYDNWKVSHQGMTIGQWATFEDEEAIGRKQYYHKYANGHHFCGSAEILALCSLYFLRIHIYNSIGRKKIRRVASFGVKGSPRIHILFNGCDHYDSLRPVSKSAEN